MILRNLPTLDKLVNGNISLLGDMQLDMPRCAIPRHFLTFADRFVRLEKKP